MNDLYLPKLPIRALGSFAANQPILMRFGPIVIRIAAFLLFGLSLYTTEYVHAREINFPVNTRMQSTIRAANLGKYFYFYSGDDSDTPETLNPELLHSWATTFEDYGLHNLVALNAFVGKTLTGDDYRVTQETVYQALFAIFLLSTLIFVSPKLPLPMSLAGVLALWLSIRYGPVELSYDARGWGPTYTAILVGMAVVTAPLLKRQFWSVVYWLGLSGITAYSILLRQEVMVAIHGSMLALIMASGLIAVVAYFTLADRGLWKRSAVRSFSRVAIAASTMIAAVIILPHLVRVIYSISWNTPYAETAFNQHGASFSLYLGLGFVSNPYNIAWLDPVGAYHAELYNPEVRAPWRDITVDAPLGEGFREIAVESPWLLGENILAKAEYVHHYLWHGTTPQPNAYTIVEQPQTLQTLYRFALVVPLLMIAVALYRKDLRLLVILGGAVALAMGACVGPLMVFPSYIGGPQGVIIFSVILLPAARTAQNTDWQDVPATTLKRIVFWTLGAIALIVIGIVILTVGWLYLRWNIHQDQLDKIVANDALEEIQELEFRYGHYFNQLEPDVQENIIASFRSASSENIALPNTEAEFEDFFQPQVAISTTHQLHLIVWLDSEYPGPIDYINQGQVYSVIQACSGCTEITRVYDYDHNALVYAFLNDTDWTDSYRMLSFAFDAAEFKEAGFFQVVAQRLRFNGGQATEFNFMVDELSEGIRLDWNLEPVE